jgi:hypothetical protein
MANLNNLFDYKVIRNGVTVWSGKVPSHMFLWIAGAWLTPTNSYDITVITDKGVEFSIRDLLSMDPTIAEVYADHDSNIESALQEHLSEE